MGRILVIISIVFSSMVLCAGLLLYLAYGLSDRPPSSQRVVGISDSTRIQLFEDGSARILAETEADAFTALGYLHAQEHGWTMALFKRTAIGGLSEWFGDDMLELDRLTLRLGLARQARSAYAALGERHQAALSAYARGVNASYERRSAGMRHEFLALEIEPDRWEPWHSLSVERLLAWMAASRPDPDTLAAAGGEVAEFFDADDLARRWLHLHGFENGLAWTERDSSGARLFQRYVYGASALPLFQSVIIESPADETLTGTSLIGTPFMPAGKRGNRSWTVLLSSSLSLQRALRDTTQVAPVYERLISADGNEHLIRVERTETEIFFPSPRPFFAHAISNLPPDDSLASSSPRFVDEGGSETEQGWVLNWSGFLQDSDADAWFALSEGADPVFRLFEGGGLELGVDGNSRILGQPLVSRINARGSLISNSPWGAFVADRFDSLLSVGDDSHAMVGLEDDRRSTWAAAIAPLLVESALAVPNQPAIVTETLAFLRNWDFAYDRASIAASIFDTWMVAYQDSLGELPEPVVSDSARMETLLYYELLVEAVEKLAEEHGDNLSQWRWEDVEPKRFYYPVFSADTLVSADLSLLPRTRYAAVEIPGSGHPTTLFWGPSPISSSLLSPARWEVLISTTDWDAFRVRTRSFRPNRFFGRYVVSDRPVPLTQVAAPELLNHTILLLPE